MKRTIVFIAGGVLIAWGALCWYKHDQKKQKQGAETGGADGVPEKTSAGEQPNELAVQPNKVHAEMIITDQPLQPAPLSQAVQYFDTNPAALYYRPRTTISVQPEVAQDVITIDSANMYAR